MLTYAKNIIFLWIDFRRNVHPFEKKHFTFCKKFRSRCPLCLWKIFTKRCKCIHLGITQCSFLWILITKTFEIFMDEFSCFVCGWLGLSFVLFSYVIENWTQNYRFYELNFSKEHRNMHKHPSSDWLMQADVIFQVTIADLCHGDICNLFKCSSCTKARINEYASLWLTNV